MVILLGVIYRDDSYVECFLEASPSRQAVNLPLDMSAVHSPAGPGKGREESVCLKLWATGRAEKWIVAVPCGKCSVSVE